ncbi:MAG TPA: patatin-like phospholipase family protein [Acidimicrobiales bacterium]|nr:patatin-like phospholipase family protein [Acidimicrobiales bacterium]
MSIRRLPFGRKGPRTVFVLGGGGNLGAVQVGMLRAVMDRGYVPDAVVGCSVGALNAAAIAADPTPAGVRRLQDIWLALRTADLFPTSRLSAVRLISQKSRSLAPNLGLTKLIAGALSFERFEESPVRFEVVATSLTSGDERWFSKGPVAPAILASAALPGVYPPVEIDGELFIDGGVVNNVPISRGLALGGERLVVFHVGNFNRPRPMPRRPLDVLLQSFSIARNHRFSLDVEQVPSSVELIVLPAVNPGALRYNDFSRSRHFIEAGHSVVASFLDARAAAAGA